MRGDEERARTRLPTQVTRDRPTFVVYGQIGAYGWFLFGLGACLLVLHQETGTASSVLALHATMVSVAGVFMGVVGAKVIGRLGRGRTMRTGSVVLGLGVVIFASGGPLWVTLAGAFVAGLGGAALSLTASAFVTSHQGPAAPATFTEMTATGASLGLIAPLAVGAGVALGWGWRPAALLTLLLLLGVEVLRGRRLDRFDEPGRDLLARSSRQSGRPTRLPSEYWWCWFVVVALVSTEFSMTLWTGQLVHVRAGLDTAAAAASVTVFVTGIAVGRIAGSQVVPRVDTERALLCAIGFALLGFVALWTTTEIAVMLVALFVMGLGDALYWPLAMARALIAAEGINDLAATRMTLAIGIAGGLAPFVLGALADAIGVHTAFLIVPLLLVSGAVVIVTRPTGPAVVGIVAPIL